MQRSAGDIGARYGSGNTISDCHRGHVGAIIGLKVFFTLWRLVEKRLNPEKADKVDNTPEVAFRGLKRKTVHVHMKNGDVLRNHKYVKTLVFGDGEFATCTLVYFELESPEGNGVFICGADIMKLESCT